MIKIIYSRYDEEAKFFNQPQVADTDDEKEFVVMSQRSLIKITDPAQINYLKDISIYQVGVFDDETGLITAFAEPIKLLACKDCIKKLGDISHVQEA